MRRSYMAAITACAMMTIMSMNETQLLMNALRLDHPSVWKLLPAVVTFLSGYCLGVIYPLVRGDQTDLKKIYGITVVLSGIGNLLSVYYNRFSLDPVYFIALFVLAFNQGLFIPTMHTMIARWVLRKERSFMTAIVYSGIPLGSVIMVIMVLLKTPALWQFVIREMLATVVIFNWKLIDISPGDSAASTVVAESSKTKPPIPLKEMCISKPLIAILIANNCCVFCLAVLNVMAVNIEQFGGKYDNLRWLPGIFAWLSTLAFGILMTYLVAKNAVTLTNSRKIATVIALLLPIIYLIFVTWMTDSVGMLVLNIFGSILSAGRITGVVTNIVDIAPNYAGVLIAGIHFIEIIISPLVLIFLAYAVGYTMNNLWVQILMLFFMIVLSLISIGLYWCWASTEEQPWNNPEPQNVKLTIRPSAPLEVT